MRCYAGYGFAIQSGNAVTDRRNRPTSPAMFVLLQDVVLVLYEGQKRQSHELGTGDAYLPCHVGPQTHHCNLSRTDERIYGGLRH